MKQIKYFIYTSRFVALMLLSFMVSCEDFVDIDDPKKELVAETVFSDERSAEAVVVGLYSQLVETSYYTALTTGLSGDELTDFSFQPNQVQFFANDILPQNDILDVRLWIVLYKVIFSSNAIVEGLENNTEITPDRANQFQGEARFIRAFCYFYLVNLFGDIPMITSTDYRENASKPREATSEIYELIINDLTIALDLLTDDYPTGEKVRANKSSAHALLARVYLYNGNWSGAETEATSVIDNTALYSLNELSDAFLPNSNEAVLQFFPTTSTFGFNTLEGVNFIIPFAPPFNVALENGFVNSLDANDLRLNAWVGNISDGTQTFYFPFKYKVRFDFTFGGDGVLEYAMVIRLAELYLIRAEARIQQDDVTGARADLNVIRDRAGLPNTTASDKSSLLLAIEQERQIELFTEWGHRWFDLKRTNRANEILGAVKANWQSTDELYPIPFRERENNPSLDQNLGYN